MTKQDVMLLGAMWFNNSTRLNDALAISMLVKIWCITLLVVLFLLLTYLVGTHRKAPELLKGMVKSIQQFFACFLLLFFMLCQPLLRQFAWPEYSVGINAMSALGEIMYIGVWVWASWVYLR